MSAFPLPAVLFPQRTSQWTAHKKQLSTLADQFEALCPVGDERVDRDAALALVRAQGGPHRAYLTRIWSSISAKIHQNFRKI